MKGDFANTSIAMDIRLGNLFDVPKARARRPRAAAARPPGGARAARSAGPRLPRLPGLPGVGHSRPQRRPAGGGARMTAGIKIRLMAFLVLSAVGIVYIAASSGLVDKVLGKGVDIRATLLILRPVRGQRGDLPRPQGRQGRRHASPGAACGSTSRWRRAPRSARLAHVRAQPLGGGGAVPRLRAGRRLRPLRRRRRHDPGRSGEPPGRRGRPPRPARRARRVRRQTRGSAR